MITYMNCTIYDHVVGFNMGKVVPGPSARTLATEAVFSKNGVVKKRIKTFETTVVDTNDNVLVFPSSDGDIDIPQVLDGVSSLEVDTKHPSNSAIRHGTLLVGFIVVITFSWSIYSLFFSVKDTDQTASSATSVVEIAQLKNDSVGSKYSLGDLKHSANLLLEKSVWNTEEINDFLVKWNEMSEQDIQISSKTTWYQLLEYQVKKQVAELQQAKTAKSISSTKEQALMTLSLIMGVMDNTVSGNSNRSELPSTNTNSDNKAKYNQLLAEISRELANAEKQSSQIASTQKSESVLYAELRKKYGALKPDPSEKTVSPAAAESAPSQLIAKATLPNRSYKNSDMNIVRNEIDALVSKYKTAYEQGDLGLMAQVFGAGDDKSAKYKSVKNNFNSTFKNSINRSINFYDTNTNISEDKAIVETKYNASVEFKNGKGIQYTVANIKLHLSRLGDQVVLNRVDILDRKVNVVSKQSSRVTSSNGMIASLNNNVSFPTAAELQDITTQLVTSYETGDLEHFLSLFSSEIKTNDRIDLSGVKKDYSELFESTSDRQMFIQNMKWTNENIGSKGTGDLEVIIFSDEGNAVYSMEGKIQIVAQKLDNKVKITHLYHIEREK